MKRLAGIPRVLRATAPIVVLSAAWAAAAAPLFQGM